MKKHTLAVLTVISLLPLTTVADGDHAKKKPGPNGGRLITAVEPNAEFLLRDDRKVQITFVGENDKIVAPAGQAVTVTTGKRSDPVTLTFEKAGETLLSQQPVPDGNNHPVVVQIRPTPDSKPVVEKFKLNLSKCPECELPEYACICGH